MSTGLLTSFLSTAQSSTPAGQTMQVKLLPRELILRNPDNKIYLVGDIEKLKEDIRLNGVRQPLEVIRWANGYKLIGGERRLTACEQLAEEGDSRFASLPCVIVESKGEVDDKIALITSNATARDLTDGERLSQYEALKDALTQKKKEGHLEGKVRDELCRILGLSAGAAARLNAISENCDEETKRFLHAGEISLMDAYRNAQNAIEKRRADAQKAAAPVTIPQTPAHAEQKPLSESAPAAETVYRNTVADKVSPPASEKEPETAHRGYNTLRNLAAKTLDDEAAWELYLEEPIFRLSYYSQDLPGGAKLWKQVDETRKERNAFKHEYERYAITLPNFSFFTNGWIAAYAIQDKLAEYFDLK